MTIFVIYILTMIFISTFCETKFDNLRKRLALEAIIANPIQNIVVSPLLVRFPLCKLASIASGYSRAELITVLGINSTRMLQNCFEGLKETMNPLKEIDVLLLNKIIVNYTDDINPNFVTNSTDYGVKVDKVGFNYPTMAVSFINRWVEKASYKRITRVLDQTDLNNKTSILLLSVAYIKVTWEFLFDIRLTKNMKFHHRNGSISYVPMMSNTASYSYLNDAINNMQYINMKLAGFGLSVTFAVPQSYKDLDKFLSQLYNNQDTLKDVFKRMRFEVVKIMLPRFKIKNTIEWNKHLKKIGVTQVFNESDSGLNEMLKKDSEIKNVMISKVKQSTFIDIDEMGIFRQEPVKELFDVQNIQKDSSFVHNNIIADRPFYFVIGLQDMYHPLEIEELFTGVYYGPKY
ncbi:serine protease inhibitor 3/4-like isoform X2 [Nymphalis io]|uniref:serine protease inhibitor 3/4-like isoform X2 n=1 Tax=Inachis io TaxID=171585 RepID=UPI00216928BA|nr:serine protease inhibitor 3/4-like isoform X2 [Nymphalis io]